MSDSKESESPPIPQTEFLQFLLSGYLGEILLQWFNDLLKSSLQKVEEGQDPYLTHLHHSQGSRTTSRKLKGDIL